MGVEKSGARFIACEWLEGQPLTIVVARKNAEGEKLSLRGAYNVIAHIARALDAAHQAGLCHGALRPAVVWISKAGRVKIAELGIARAILKNAGAVALGATEQPFLAPEVRGGAAPNIRTDVFGIGGLLYTMLTGRSAGEDFVPPSVAHPEAGPEIDAILLKCLAADPAARYASPEEVRAALSPHCGGGQGEDEAESGKLGIDIDIDVDMAVSEIPPPSKAASVAMPANLRAPAAPVAPAAPAQKPAAPAQKPAAPAQKPAAPAQKPAAVMPKLVTNAEAPRVGARVSIHEEFRASIPQPAAVIRPSEVDLGKLVHQITENDAARWMVEKDRLDHGPFAGRELINMIANGEVLGDHSLLNMDTGERKQVCEYPEFIEFVEQYRLKKAALDEKSAIASAAKVEKASNAAKFMIASGVVVSILLLVGVYFLTRQSEQTRTVADADLADLYERGEVQIEGSAGILPDPPRGSGGRRSGARRAGGGAGTSYEDAMNQVVEIGDATRSGGEGRLSPAQVVGAMNGRINTLFSCVSEELRSGRTLGRVRVDLAIAGSGQVLGSSVRAGSPEFQRCVQQRVAAVRFPSFGAPRMGASYTFDASQ
jgi:serine/threonine-protein kinase